MDDQGQPSERGRKSPTISFLRTCLWLFPSVSFAFCFLEIGRMGRIGLNGSQLVLIFLIGLSALGCANQWLRLRQLRGHGITDRESVLFGVVIYVILQSALSPFLGGAMAFGACLVKLYNFH